MKVVQTKAKTSASPATQVENTGAPFFVRGGEQSFFHSKTTDQPFFSKSPGAMASKTGINGGTIGRGASIQAKLAVGKPNDPYEKQADAMADKVVQRLSAPPPSKKEIHTAKSSQPAVQAKCSECEKEEKLQKKEDSKEAPKKVLRKAIFESNEDKGVQRKVESIPPVQKKQAPVQLKAAPVVPVSAPAVQAKCSACDNEEKIQEKEDDTDNDAGPGIQKKPIFESNAEPKEEMVQRSCRECEEGNEVLLKPEGMVQRDATYQEASGDGSRESILAIAKGELGKVQSKQNDGSGRRVGADRLLEYFHLAAPGVWDDSIIETAGAEMPSWCGIFSVWAHKKAGKDIGNWEMGKGVSAFGTLTKTDNPLPGDIGYIHKTNQHHCIVERIDGDNVHTIDGNSGAFGEVIENTRPRSKFDLFLTAFGGAAPAGTVQAKGEGDSGIVQTKSGDSVASPSVEEKISSTKGKGDSLPESARTGMEQSFGADFSNVKIHTDSSAVQMSKDLHAQAFTHGSDIYFNSGKYNTGSTSGQHLLAHELTHVVQQGSAPPSVVNRAAVVDDPGDEGSEQPLPEGAQDPDAPPPTSQEEMEREAQQDLSEDNFQDSQEKPEDEASEEGPAPSPSGENDAEQDSEEDEGPDAADEQEPGGGGGEAEGDKEKGGDTVPDGTPAPTAEDKCPQIAPDLPEPPKDSTLPPTEDEAFYKELLDIMSNNALMPGVIFLRPFGVAAYFAWRKLPMFVKIRVINFVLDKAIGGAYFGRYADFDIGNSKIISAALLGFFRRLRRLGDDQKVYMFEKFGKMILRGDTRFTLGLLKGILIGFFLDGLLGIIQMVIDLICIVPKILNFFSGIKNFLADLPGEVQMILVSIQDFWQSLQDFMENAIDELMEFLKDPNKIVQLMKQVEDAVLGAAEKIGEGIADGMIRYAALPAAQLGELVGRIGGQLLFEAALAFVTKGGGAAVTAAKTALRGFGKALATIGRQIFSLVKQMGKVFKFVKGVINSIIKFLTPLLKFVATMARRVIDKISDLFKAFRRFCKPGSVKCKLPKGCKGKDIPRIGGPRGAAYARRITGSSKDFMVTTKLFGALPAICVYDGKKAQTLLEVKTGYRYLPYLKKKSFFYRVIMARLSEQRGRCLAIAIRCGKPYLWFMQDKGAAEFLNARWKGFPPVLHRK